ncbi:MAG: tRNA threonylcarbamoyladenosine dehydratase, partial [Treponema sp.]|nr:tRNA threonylcarbamoyladenosine dehydratase [Treponema sp.]
AGIWETRGCPLARLVRQGLRRRGFAGSFIAVYSDEPPWRNDETAAGEQEPSGGGKAVNGSAVTVTASAGMVLASLVLRGITGEK